jgi:dipeptidyl aminopeptidase/acylaminoacyl peptidase
MSNNRIIAAMAATGLLACLAAGAVFADEAPAEFFAQQPIMTGAQLSPDGQRIAFISSLQGRNHIVIERFKPGFSRTMVSPGDEWEFEWVRWANADRLVISASFFAMRMMTEVTETRLFSVSALGQDLRPIIKPSTFKVVGSRIPKEHLPAQIQDEVIDWLPDEPDHILVAIDADHDGSTEVRKVNVNDGDFDVVLDGFAGFRNWLTNSHGEVALGWWQTGVDELVLSRRLPDGSWVETDRPPWLVAGFVPVAFTGNDNFVVAIGPGEKGRKVARTVDLSTDQFVDTLFEHDVVDAEIVIKDGHSGRAIGVGYTEHLPEHFYFDEAARRLQATIDRALQDTTNLIVSESEGKRQILIFAFSDTNPGAYYLWDRDEKSLNLYSEAYKGATDYPYAPIRPVTYKARDGLEIPAYLTTPHGEPATPLPAVVLPHGGPYARTDMTYDFLRQFLASRGYVVLQPNFRGSSGYGQGFAEAGLKEYGGKMQDDVSDGAAWLVEEGIADPDRICIVGWSYGGYAAAMGAVKTPDLYRCAVSINGILNLPVQVTQEREYVGADNWVDNIGLEGASLRAVSPYHQAAKIGIPMLIIQASDDPVVRRSQGRGMHDRLADLDKDVRYVEVEFGGHTMHTREARLAILDAIEAFLEQHLR